MPSRPWYHRMCNSHESSDDSVYPNQNVEIDVPIFRTRNVQIFSPSTNDLWYLKKVGAGRPVLAAGHEQFEWIQFQPVLSDDAFSCMFARQDNSNPGSYLFISAKNKSGKVKLKKGNLTEMLSENDNRVFRIETVNHVAGGKYVRHLSSGKFVSVNRTKKALYLESNRETAFIWKFSADT